MHVTRTRRAFTAAPTAVKWRYFVPETPLHAICCFAKAIAFRRNSIALPANLKTYPRRGTAVTLRLDIVRRETKCPVVGRCRDV